MPEEIFPGIKMPEERFPDQERQDLISLIIREIARSHHEPVNPHLPHERLISILRKLTGVDTILISRRL